MVDNTENHVTFTQNAMKDWAGLREMGNRYEKNDVCWHTLLGMQTKFEIGKDGN